MYKKSITLLCCLSMLFFTTFARAGVVEKFDPFPTSVTLDAKDYVGILVSEQDFIEITKMKIKLKYSEKLLENLNKELEQKNSQLEKSLSIVNGMMDEINYEIKNESWFEKNKVVISLVTGFVLGSCITIGATYAVSR